MEFYRTEDGIYRARAFERFGWLTHGFGTRENPQVDLPGLSTLRQVHSDRAVEASAPGCLGEGDALFAQIPGRVIGVKTADCVPVLLVDARSRAVAAVHAGWRGTVARIAARTLEAMQSRFGTRPEDVEAAIGPAIAACCFEVGPEVSAGFRELFPERMDLESRVHIDLHEANRRILIQAGVAPDSIHVAGHLCTRCSDGEFCSYRRDRDRAGRMVSAIGICRTD